MDPGSKAGVTKEEGEWAASGFWGRERWQTAHKTSTFRR